MMASNDPVIPQADVQGFATVSEVSTAVLLSMSREGLAATAHSTSHSQQSLACNASCKQELNVLVGSAVAHVPFKGKSISEKE